MDPKKRELIAIALLAAICAGAAWTFGYEFFALVFVLEGAIAGAIAIL